MASADIQKLVWIAAGILAVLIAAGLIWWLLKALVFNGGAKFFGGRERRRLALVEWTAIGGGRQLLLVRRDDVEHLILTGGPIDVVVESGIGKEEPVMERVMERFVERPAIERPAVERVVESPPVHTDFPRFEHGEAHGFESGRDASGRRSKADDVVTADNGRYRGAGSASSSHSDTSPLILTPEQAE